MRQTDCLYITHQLRVIHNSIYLFPKLHQIDFQWALNRIFVLWKSLERKIVWLKGHCNCIFDGKYCKLTAAILCVFLPPCFGDA